MEYIETGGARIPVIGLGTARMDGKVCRSAVRSALEVGYRHIDTAQMYGNEAEVGEAINSSDVDREDIFLTTKLSHGLDFENVMESFNRSLNRLNLDYVDLLLIHSPSRKVPVGETLEAMNNLQRQEKVEHIGVSNFSVKQLEEAVKESDTPIVTNQVKYNAYHRQDEILEHCQRNGLALTAHTPLALGRLAGEKLLKDIGDRYSRDAAQVALRWLIQQEGIAAIPKASKHKHIIRNIDVFNFSLTGREMERINNLKPGLGHRLKSILGIF